MIINNGMKEDTQPFSHDIRIDKEGAWYYRGAEMFRKDIVDLLYRHLRRDEKGRYLIEFDSERSYVDVEDTPFVIKAIYRSPSHEKEDSIDLLMPDGGMEKLDPSTLRIGDNDALYCTISRQGFDARFSRASYYQIAEYIEQEHDAYFISLNGHRYYIKKT